MPQPGNGKAGTDGALYCPVCCGAPEVLGGCPKLGPTCPQVPGKTSMFSSSGDGCAKARRLKGAGRGDTSRPALAFFQGDAHDRLRQHEDNPNRENLADAAETESCPNARKYAKTHAAKSALYDEQNLFGCVCGHGFPNCSLSKKSLSCCIKSVVPGIAPAGHCTAGDMKGGYVRTPAGPAPSKSTNRTS